MTRNKKFSTFRNGTLALATAGVVLLIPVAAYASLPIYPGPGIPPNAGAKPYINPRAIKNNNTGDVVTIAAVSSPSSITYVMRWSPRSTDITFLGDNGNGTPRIAAVLDINSAGTSVGYSYPSPSFTSVDALRWPLASATPNVLGTLGTPAPPTAFHARAADINDAGTTAGSASKYSGTTNLGERAVFWPGGSLIPTELAQLSTSTSGTATSMASLLNSNGTIFAGSAANYVGNNYASGSTVRWTNGGTTVSKLTELTPISGGINRTQLYGMTDSGTIVGVSNRYASGLDLGPRAVRWDAGSTAIAELLAPNVTNTSEDWTSEARGINNAGMTVGNSVHTLSSNTGNFFDSRALRWAPGTTTPTVLGNLNIGDGADQTYAFCINNLGTIGGYGNVLDTAVPHAALWFADSNQPLDLMSLVPAGGHFELQSVTAISDTGYVSGSGLFDPDGAGSMAAYRKLFEMLVPKAGTYGRGDANFDTKVNFADLVILAQHYNQSNAIQNTDVADFDLNGVTDFNDLVTLAQNYGAGVENIQSVGSAPFAADWALAQSLVPEPTSLAMLSVPAAVLSRSRRRNSHQ